MAMRKSMSKRAPLRPELEKLLADAVKKGVSEDELQEQRVSFAFGNAPVSAKRITKESVREASHRQRLRRA